jgi:hypothetical protein
MRYAILGFPNSGSTSLESYLKQEGHDVIRHEMAYKLGHKAIDDLIRGRKVIIITREGTNAYKLDQKRLLERFDKWDPEIVKLEEMKKINTFPLLNKS